ncbi:MAG: hypothetical protein RLZZ244_823 [Verrucomicrobiota bacterium]
MRTQRACNAQGRGPVRGRGGFTLLEVMVGVAVLGLMIFSMYRLVGTVLLSLEDSRVAQLETTVNEGVVRYLQESVKAIPPRQPDAIRGMPHLVGQASADEVTWVARAGVSLLTSAAPDDDYAVTLTLQPSAATSRQQDLGLRRRLVSEPESQYEWIPLVPDVAAFELRYFHPALAQWVERWEDANQRPALIRMKLWRRASEWPFEVVLAVPASKIQ